MNTVFNSWLMDFPLRIAYLSIIKIQLGSVVYRYTDVSGDNPAPLH
jgi:hypothetical protein